MVYLQDVLAGSSLFGIQVTLKTAWPENLLAKDDRPEIFFYALFYPFLLCELENVSDDNNSL